MSVTDLSWVARQSGNTFDLADTSHLYLARWETKAVLLRYPHCALPEVGSWEGRGGGPHLDRPRILPALAPVARDAPRLSTAIKGCLPTGATRVGCCSPMSPLSSLLPVKEAKSDGLNPPTTHQLRVLSECINKCTFHGVDVQGLCRCGSVMLA